MFPLSRCNTLAEMFPVKCVQQVSSSERGGTKTRFLSVLKKICVHWHNTLKCKHQIAKAISMALAVILALVLLSNKWIVLLLLMTAVSIRGINLKLLIIVKDAHHAGISFVCILSTPQVKRHLMVVQTFVLFLAKLQGD